MPNENLAFRAKANAWSASSSCQAFSLMAPDSIRRSRTSAPSSGGASRARRARACISLGRLAPVSRGSRGGCASVTVARRLAAVIIQSTVSTHALRALSVSPPASVAVCVALEPQRGDPCRRHRRLRDAARRDADLNDSSVHPQPPWRASVRAPRLYASAATRGRARGASCRPGSPHVCVSSADARVLGTGGWLRPGRGRGAVARRAATPSGFR